jgi:phosphoribosylglycinamide formyltransferase-1
MKRLDLGILASHEGSGMQAVADACGSGYLGAKVCVVISNNRDANVLKRAETENIPHFHLSAVKYPDPELLDIAIADKLTEYDVDTVLLAGYMKRLGPEVLKRFKGRIINIHPALLPKYGGRGMYGRHVHEAVIRSGDKTTGITIHLVDEAYDTGKILNQCTVGVKKGDTADTLADRVLEREHTFYVETLKMICDGMIKL